MGSWIGELIQGIATSPGKFTAFHWLGSFSLGCTLLLLILVLALPLGPAIKRKITSGWGSHFARGVFCCGLVLYGLCSTIGFRFFLVFSAAHRASLFDIFIPRKGASLLELVSQLPLYFSAMLSCDCDMVLILGLLANCVAQMWNQSALTHVAAIVTSVVAARGLLSRGNKKAFGLGTWMLAAGFCLPCFAYGLKLVRIL